MKTPHKHADLIHAWANGDLIEGQDIAGDWFITFHPDWRRDGPYRVYKEPKPDVVRYGIATRYFGKEVAESGDNIKLTFNGETNKLKAVEVI